MSYLSPSDEKKLQLVYALLNEPGCQPWEDGPAAALKLFSDDKFRELLQGGEAHLALDYAYPFLKRIEIDGQASPAFWQLHDGLVARAIADAQGQGQTAERHDKVAACVLPRCLRKQATFATMLALGAQLNEGPLPPVEQLMGLLPQVEGLAEARQNVQSMEALQPLEGLKEYILRADEALEARHARRAALTLHKATAPDPAVGTVHGRLTTLHGCCRRRPA